MILLIIGILVVLVFLLELIDQFRSKKRAQLTNPANRETPTRNGKPIILLIIDSLMDQPLQETIEIGKAPALKFLMEKGKYLSNIVSAFPTMSVTIDSTLLTGKLPREHHIYGLIYYDPQEKRIINYGTGFLETVWVGVKQVVQDSMLHLNQRHLNPKTLTIHEELGDTASINAMVYRGPHEQTIHTPWAAKFFGFLPSTISTKATRYFSFGQMHRISSDAQKGMAWYRYGMNDRFTAMELISLIKEDLLPSFTIGYLPDNDAPIHVRGADELKGIEKADQELQRIFNAFPSWEEALESCIWIVMGDSGQANMLANSSLAHIDLEPLFSSYSITSAKQKRARSSDQLAICVNERMTYIYLLDHQIPISEIVDHCRQESRLDLIAWQEEGRIHVVSGQREGHFQYRPGDQYLDSYGQRWDLEGDHSLVDLRLGDDQNITYGDYPDVLMRLYGVMDTAERVVIITCAPGYEMIYKTSVKHPGGSHGSLHYLDSLVPMIICGTDSEPTHHRIIDLKDWLVDLAKKQKNSDPK